MSLIPASNAGAPGLSYGISNAGTTAAPVVASGSLSIAGDGLGAAYINAANRVSSSTPGSLHLGANPDVYDVMVLTSSPSSAVIVNTDLNMPVGGSTLRLQNGASLLCTGTATFQGPVNMTASLPTLYQQSVAFATPDGTNNGVLPQPVSLPAATYAITLSNTAEPALNLSMIARWNGAIWSAGGTAVGVSFPGGGVPAVINRGIIVAPGGATLEITNGTGTAMSGFVYYTAISAN